MPGSNHNAQPLKGTCIMADNEATIQLPWNGRVLCNLARRSGISIANEGDNMVWKGAEIAFKESGLFASGCGLDWGFKARRWIYTREGIRGDIFRDGTSLRLIIRYFNPPSFKGMRALADKAGNDATYLAFKSLLLRPLPVNLLEQGN